MADEFGEELKEQSKYSEPTFEEEKGSEKKSFYSSMKGKNSRYLLKLDKEERKRIAREIIKKYREAEGPHKDLCQKLDQWDEVYRILRSELPGTDGSMPNYRMPISTVAHEVVHANVMNVFFTPTDVMRVLPTEENDIPKVDGIETFGNWSLRNELDVFNGCDRLFHNSEKNGESVAMIYWKKEYGVDIKREVKVDENGEPMYDEQTGELIYNEYEKTKLLYNAPVMEVISRKDYIQPSDARMGEDPDWEARILRLSYDQFLKEQLSGKYYDGSIDEIKHWPATGEQINESMDLQGNSERVGAWKKEFIEWYGRMRVTVVKDDLNERQEIEYQELEDEVEALVNIETETLCFMKKNRRPMKMRPFVNDYFIPDDTGRRAGIGIYEFMDSLQKAYDALFNNFINATDLQNQPIVFFTPLGNMRDEKFKIQRGFAYPTADANTVKLFQFPGPSESLKFAMELVQQWAQFLFGISDYAAGMESSIDPSAPAKKVEMVVAQGNVRLNMIIKRKADTLKKLFLKWFLLYRDNMPTNKFMRIAGGANNSFEFKAIRYEDFELKGLPDFQLVGNVLNSNKQMELNKAVAMYQLLAANPLFMPNTREGLQNLIQLVKWLMDKVDDIGLKAFLPEFKEGQVIHTPEEENAYFLQGESVDPLPGEDWVYHLKTHTAFINNPNTPEEIKSLVGEHIKATLKVAQQEMAQKIAQQWQLSQMPAASMMGGQGGQPGQAGPAPSFGGGIPEQS